MARSLFPFAVIGSIEKFQLKENEFFRLASKVSHGVPPKQIAGKPFGNW